MPPFLSILLTLTTRPIANDVAVVVDPRVELLTTVFRLAGSGEFQGGGAENPYAKRVDAYFAPYKGLAAVKDAERLRTEFHVGYDAVAQLAISLSDVRSLKEKVPFDLSPKRWDARLNVPATRKLVADLREFVRTTHYLRFFESEAPYFRGATKSLAALMTRYEVPATMNRFFGQAPKRPARVCVGLLCGGGNYGMAVEYPNGDLEMAPIIGAYRFDPSGYPVYSETDLSVVRHEFSHPFVNPAVRPYLDELRPYVEKLRPRLADAYRYQGYGASDSIVYETMVRAVQNHLDRKALSAGDALQVTIWQRCAGFLAVSDLADALDEYESDRRKYPRLSDFMPVLVKRFEALTADPEGLYARCPQVSDFRLDWKEVADAKQRVVLKVTFDRPMLPDRFGSWMEGGDAEQVGAFAFDDSKRVMTTTYRVPVGQKPSFVINPQGWGCVSESGYPALTCRFPVVPPGNSQSESASGFARRR